MRTSFQRIFYDAAYADFSLLLADGSIEEVPMGNALRGYTPDRITILLIGTPPAIGVINASLNIVDSYVSGATFRAVRPVAALNLATSPNVINDVVIAFEDVSTVGWTESTALSLVLEVTTVMATDWDFKVVTMESGDLLFAEAT